jgi:hypothetical protein
MARQKKAPFATDNEVPVPMYRLHCYVSDDKNVYYHDQSPLQPFFDIYVKAPDDCWTAVVIDVEDYVWLVDLENTVVEDEVHHTLGKSGIMQPSTQVAVMTALMRTDARRAPDAETS